MMMEDEKDLVQDEEIKEEGADLQEHKDSDAEKWDKVFGKLDDLTKRLDGFEEWVNKAIAGVDKTEADEAQDTAEQTGPESEEELAALDSEFYKAQEAYLR